jgi:RNA polymerase sigma-70 factor (ECF subfamily)
VQNLSDQELAELCRRGDRAAQREVYARTAERIYGLLFRMTRSRDRAFDLAQDTYVRAFTHMHQFNGNASLATWLYRIAVNEALQAARQQAAASAKLRTLPRPQSTDCTHEHVAVQIDVAEALAALSPQDRAILLLRYHEGLDYGTISEVTGCAPGTVASRLNRARDKLRNLLSKGYEVREGSDPPPHPTGERSGAEPEPNRAARPDGEQSAAVSP